jgi:dihydroorotase
MQKLSEWANQDSYIIANVTVVDPAAGKVFPGFVGIEAGKIAFVESGRPQPGSKTVFDGGGFHLSPGFVDIHVHLREPGFEHKETILSGTRAAVAGGFTSVACMPNTDPAIDDKSVVEFVIKKANVAGLARVFPIAAATIGRKGETLTEFGALVDAGAVAVSDDGAPVATAQMVRRVMEYSAHFGIPFIEHCEDVSTSAGGVMHEGFYSTKLGLKGVPSMSEEICLARDVIVLQSVDKARFHGAHLSSRGSVRLIREAKARGLAVTAETAPHYLSFRDSDLQSFDTHLKINPPIRSDEDQIALIEGLKDGTLDCIASDHAPHAPQEKEVEFDEAPSGAIGLETTFSVIMTELVKPGHLDLPRALALITHRPAGVLGLPAGTLTVGRAADLVLFDPREERVVQKTEFRSKSTNSPYIGRRLFGTVKHTVVGGKLVSAALRV